MAIPEGFLEELKARAGLAELIGKRVRLTRRGREFVGLCPFHNEKTPSFTVNEQKGFYHCFGCGAHGSAIDFIMSAEGLGFRDAVERLAAGVGLALPAETPADRARAERRRTLFEVTEMAARFFETSLRSPAARGARDYFRGRGLEDETIKRFRLGFAPDARAALKTALSREGVGENLMVEAGLLTVPEGADRSPYDRFRGRVMFPIADRRGRIVAFGGRVIGAGEPKYLNSPETPVFHKGRMLYGLDAAANAAREAGTVIVVEGYMDVIALHAAGYPQTVAPLGTALTEEQLTELWRLVPEPVLMFDPDAAGRRAATRAVERALPLVRSGLGLRFAFLDTATGDDPDGVVRRYPRQFMGSALSAALSLSDMLFWTESQGRRLDTPEDRAALEARLRRHIAKIVDPDLRRAMQSAFRARLRARQPDRRRAAAGVERRSVPGARPPDVAADDSTRQLEKVLIAVLICYPEAFERIGERLGALGFASPELDSLRQEVLFRLTSQPDLDGTDLQSHLLACGYSDLLDSLSGARVFFEAAWPDGTRPEAALSSAIEAWEEAYIRHRQRGLRKELNERKRDLADRLSSDTFEQFASLKHQENKRPG